MTRPVAAWWLAAVGGLGLGVGTAAAGQGVAPARYIPAKGLAAYAEFDGIDAHADAWKGTAAYAAMNRTPAGAMIADVAAQLLGELIKDLPGGRRAGPEVVALQEHLIRSGFACGLDDSGGATVAIRGAGRAEVRERFERLLRLAAEAGDAKTSEPKRVRGRSVVAVPGGVSWWAEGDDLILVTGKAEERVGAVIDALDGRQPAAAAHPTRLALLKDEVDFESDGLFFVERKALAAVAGFAAPKPLEGLTLPPARYLEDDVKFIAPEPAPPAPHHLKPYAPATAPPADATPAPIAPDAPPKLGAPPEADAPGGRAEPPIDPAIPPVTIPSVPGPVNEVGPDRQEAFEERKPQEILTTIHAPARPDPVGDALEGIERIEGRWGFRGKALAGDVRVVAPAPRKGWAALVDQPAFRKDNLPPIPEGVTSFTVLAIEPGKAYRLGVELLKGINPEAKGQVKAVEKVVADATGLSLRDDLLAHLGPRVAVFDVPARPADLRNKGKGEETDPVVLAEVDDAAAFARALDALAAGVNDALKEAGGGAPACLLRPLPAPARGYVLGPAPGFVEPVILAKLRPTVMLGKSFVAFAATPEEATAALAAEAGTARRWAPAGEVADAFAQLPETLTLLDVVDPRRTSMPGMIAGLPTYAQFLGNAGRDDSAEGRSPFAGLLAALGLPAPGGFRVRLDPALTVKADDVKAPLFPDVLAASVDGRGVRIIGRGSIPPGLRIGRWSLSTSFSASPGETSRRKAVLKWKFWDE